jgi:hypothetical protein
MIQVSEPLNGYQRLQFDCASVKELLARTQGVLIVFGRKNPVRPRVWPRI